MASVALSFAGSAVGTAIGGPVGGFVGNLVGGYIGGLIDNMLFGVPKQEGPRLDDLRVISSAYGQPIPRIWGPENRLSGNLIWSTGLIETAKKSRQGGKGGPSVDVIEYAYRTSLAVALSGRQIRRIVKIWANGEVIFNAGASTALVFQKGDGTHEVFDTLRVYQGTLSQTPDPTIESYKGAGNVPGYIGTAYCVIADLQLADFGNRVPNLEFLVEADEEISVGAVVTEICEAAGIDPMTVSTWALTDLVRGFIVARESTCHDALQPLALAYDFDTAEVWGSLRFQKRGTAAAGTIVLDDLAGHEFPNDRPEPLRWTRATETMLPLKAVLTYADPERDFQSNSQSRQRSGGNAQSNLSTELALTLGADHAREIADRMLWEAWTGRTTADGAVNDKWIGIEPGRAYVVPTPVGPERLRLAQKTRGANGVIEVRFRRDRTVLYNTAATGAIAAIPENELTLAGPATLLLLDIPILADNDDDAGFYWFVSGDPAGWRGAEVQRSSDSGATYQTMDFSGSRATMGDVSGVVPDGSSTVFDRETVITVTLDHDADELESVETLDLLNGANACWIGPEDGDGGEILQFETATAISGGVYELSGLLRGRLGTEHETELHGAGERFLLLDASVVNRNNFGASDWNKPRLYKGISLLQSASEVDDQEFTNTGEGRRPLSPVHVRGYRDGSDDLEISWIRRSRYRQPGLGNGPLAVGEQDIEFEIDVIAGGNVVRTITVNATSAEYTAAQQTADGLTPGDPVTVDVYQISDSRGRGLPRRATI